MSCPKCGSPVEPGRVMGAFFFFISGKDEVPAPADGLLTAPGYGYSVPAGVRVPWAEEGVPRFGCANHTVHAQATRCMQCGHIAIDAATVVVTPPVPRKPGRPWYRRLFGGAGGSDT